MISKENIGAYGVMYVVHNKKNDVIALLLKNGVVAPSNASDIQIALLVTNLLKVSKSFYRDFSALLLSKETISGMSSNMSGSYANATGFNSSDYTLPTFDFVKSTPSTIPTTTVATNTSSSSWLNQGLGFLQTGFQGYLQLDDNKTKRALADASVKITADTATSNQAIQPKTGMSTGAIVGLSLLGVTIVGVIAYLIIKNKSNAGKI